LIIQNSILSLKERHTPRYFLIQATSPNEPVNNTFGSSD